MGRKYLSGPFTPSAGLSIPETEIENAKFIFDEDYSDFEDTLVGVVGLWDGDTLLINRYAVYTLDPGEYDDVELELLQHLKVNLNATNMEIAQG